jgi:hypothetical protein
MGVLLIAVSVLPYLGQCRGGCQMPTYNFQLRFWRTVLHRVSPPGAFAACDSYRRLVFINKNF